MMDSVSLGTDVDTGAEVRLGIAERRQGLYIIGKTGTGKTTLLEHLIVQDICAGLGVCVLDPHGDLIDAVLARVPAEREQDVILLDLADSQYPFGLNLFECKDTSDRNLVSRVATQAVEVFEKLWGGTSWGPQLAQVLRNCAYTLIENQGYSLADLRRLLLNAEFRAGLVAKVTNPQVAEFWELEYNPMRAQDQQQIVRSTLNKVDEFLTPTVYPIVGYGRTTMDFREAMDEGAVVLVRLGLGEVGAAPVSLIGSMIVGQIFNAALSRQNIPPSERRQFSLYADEYHRFATPAFAELLAEARKYAVATTLAHQFRGQLTDEANRGATLNAANLIAFGVHGEDAEELAKQFDRTPPAPNVAGLRPKLSVSQNPIEHLVRAGHNNPRVRDIVASELSEWAHASRHLPEGNLNWARAHQSMPFEDKDILARYKAGRASYSGGLRAFDQYLVELMEGRVELRSRGEAHLLTSLMVELRGVIGFARDFREPGWNFRVPFPDESWTALKRFIEVFVGSQVDSDMMVGAARAYLVEVRKEESQSFIRGGAKHHVVVGEVNRMEAHLTWARELARLLVESPVMVDSGQFEPYYDRPRSYADVEAEIASKLVALPKFHASCRILNGNRVEEHMIRTPEYIERDGNQAELEHFRERTRRDYCIPLASVLDAIRSRQSGTLRSESLATTRRVSISPAGGR
jgi:Type IV secretion-system coupling protein DNA-binding domain